MESFWKTTGVGSTPGRRLQPLWATGWLGYHTVILIVALVLFHPVNVEMATSTAQSPITTTTTTTTTAAPTTTILCHEACEGCDGPSDDDCVRCSEDFYCENCGTDNPQHSPPHAAGGLVNNGTDTFSSPIVTSATTSSAGVATTSAKSERRTCVRNCSEGYYEDERDPDLKKCTSCDNGVNNCTKCTCPMSNDTVCDFKCLGCPVGQYLHKEKSCVRECPDGFEADGKVCVEEGDGGDNLLVIILPVVLGVVIIIIIVVVIIVVVIRKRRRREKPAPPPAKDELITIPPREDTSQPKDVTVPKECPIYQNVPAPDKGLPRRVEEGHDNVLRYTPDPTANVGQQDSWPAKRPVNGYNDNDNGNTETPGYSATSTSPPEPGPKTHTMQPKSWLQNDVPLTNMGASENGAKSKHRYYNLDNPAPPEPESPPIGTVAHTKQHPLAAVSPDLEEHLGDDQPIYVNEDIYENEDIIAAQANPVFEPEPPDLGLPEEDVNQGGYPSSQAAGTNPDEMNPDEQGGTYENCELGRKKPQEFAPQTPAKDYVNKDVIEKLAREKQESVLRSEPNIAGHRDLNVVETPARNAQSVLGAEYQAGDMPSNRTDADDEDEDEDADDALYYNQFPGNGTYQNVRKGQYPRS